MVVMKMLYIELKCMQCDLNKILGPYASICGLDSVIRFSFPGMVFLCFATFPRKQHFSAQKTSTKTCVG